MSKEIKDAVILNPGNTAESAKAKTPWYGLLLQAIGFMLVMKLLGAAGGLVACLVYYWVKPKKGVGLAIGAGLVAGVGTWLALTAMLVRSVS